MEEIRELSEYKLTELIDVEVLQRMQEAIAGSIGITSVTLDKDKYAVTKPSNFPEYCANCVMSDPDKRGCAEAIEIAKNEKPQDENEFFVCACPSGFFRCIYPIETEGVVLGYVVGGNERFARKSGDNPEGHVSARNRAFVDYIMRFLRTTANIVADMAGSKYRAICAKADIERAANMKSDFLANMSHEIRTPMNAVIGMAEMALREDLPPQAREYINQIKASGHSLLNIINDILDFSKIDSGKMDIIPVDYEILSMFNDVANIVTTRLKDKPVELLLEIDPSLPCELYGDNQRVRQILINLANNAVKFTRKGRVKIEVDYDKIDDDNIMMNVSVKDTGIGIKKEDIVKLFDSFQQLDSKRNRNIEGTGLGLAISRRLCTLMGGNLNVESEYEKGSNFSFSVPQRVVDWKPCIVAREAEHQAVMGFFTNKYIARQFYKDTGRLGVYNISLVTIDDFDDTLKYNQELLGDRKLYFFIEKNDVDEKVKGLVRKNPNMNCVVMVDYFDEYKPEMPNMKVLKKPLSSISIAMMLNNEKFSGYGEEAVFECDFIAPTAKVLLVDDNAINLTVAAGLLEPLQMQTHTADSGKKAIDMIEKEHFDLIFMDHMMPELDGVETTRIIRRLYPSYNDVPIIALTANAIEGTKEMFLEEGMNDFVAKPIEVRTLVEKVKEWLPIEKIEKASGIVEMAVDNVSDETFYIADLDTDAARKLLNNDNLFWSMLKTYYKAIIPKAGVIAESMEKKDWAAYTIEVHALKSSSKQIGAMELSQMAAELEKAGNARDINYIFNNTDKMLEKYIEYSTLLQPFCEEEATKSEEPKDLIRTDQLLELLDRMQEASDNLDMDEMEVVIGEMKNYGYLDASAKYMARLTDAVDSIDVDAISLIIENWKNLI